MREVKCMEHEMDVERPKPGGKRVQILNTPTTIIITSLPCTTHAPSVPIIPVHHRNATLGARVIGIKNRSLGRYTDETHVNDKDAFLFQNVLSFFFPYLPLFFSFCQTDIIFRHATKLRV